MPADLNFEDVKNELYKRVPNDLWADAKVGEVLEYLYSNKRLRLTADQKQMLHELASAWATEDDI